MADTNECTLRDLEVFALERCALGLRVLSDKSQYEFERKVVFQESTMTARECDVLNVGYYSDRPQDHVYADLDYDTGRIVYYDGRKGVNISAASEARKVDPDSACFPKELKHLQPFSGVAYLTSARGSRRAPKTVAQGQNRTRLALMIKFAYLLTGRVSSISHNSPKDWNVRDEFVQLCTIAQRREDHKERAKKVLVKAKNNNLGGMSGNDAQPTMHNAWPDQPQDSAEGALSLTIRVSKRKVIDLTNSDDDAKSSVQGPQVKRHADTVTSRASLHPGAGSNDYSMIDDADETGGVSLTNDMIESPRALPARPISIEQRFKTATELPQRDVEPLEQDLRAERERAKKAEREARQAKLEAEHWKGKFKKLMETKVTTFLDAI